MRDGKGRFVKGSNPSNGFPKGHIPWNKGIKGEIQLSEETIKKILKSKEWYRPSEETKEKIRKALLGHIQSDETKLKISLAKKGKKRIGIPHTEETKEKLRLANLGKHPSEETRKKLSESHKGEKGSNWQGGITPINEKLRKHYKYDDWRIAVFEKDNYTCQFCGDNKGGNLNAHHIKPFSKFPELRLDINNGITLCDVCHRTKGLHKGLGRVKLLVD